MSTIHAFDDARLEPPDGYYDTDGAHDPCNRCGGSGEVWVDVEMWDGRVREDMHVCGCGA